MIVLEPSILSRILLASGRRGLVSATALHCAYLSHAFCHLAVPRNEGALCRYWCQFHCEELINRVPPPKLNAGCYIFQLWKPASQRRVPGKWNKYREGRYNFNLHDCIGRYDHSVCARRCMALILRLIFSRLPFRAIRRLL